MDRATMQAVFDEIENIEVNHGDHDMHWLLVLKERLEELEEQAMEEMAEHVEKQRETGSKIMAEVDHILDTQPTQTDLHPQEVFVERHEPENFDWNEIPS